MHLMLLSEASSEKAYSKTRYDTCHTFKWESLQEHTFVTGLFQVGKPKGKYCMLPVLAGKDK